MQLGMVPGLGDWRSLRWWLCPNWCLAWMPSWYVWAKASTMVWYRGCWRRMERFFASRGVQEFSLDLAMAWVDQARGDSSIRNRPAPSNRPTCSFTEAKRKALEAAYTEVVTTDLPEWNQSSELLNSLASL